MISSCQFVCCSLGCHVLTARMHSPPRRLHWRRVASLWPSAITGRCSSSLPAARCDRSAAMLPMPVWHGAAPEPALRGHNVGVRKAGISAVQTTAVTTRDGQMASVIVLTSPINLSCVRTALCSLTTWLAAADRRTCKHAAKFLQCAAPDSLGAAAPGTRPSTAPPAATAPAATTRGRGAGTRAPPALTAADRVSFICFAVI